MIPALKGPCAAALSGLVVYVLMIQGRRDKARSPLATFCRASRWLSISPSLRASSAG